MSNIGNWGYQDNFKPVCFLFTKRFHAHKNTHKQKQTKKTKISEQKTTKAAISSAQRLLRSRNRFLLGLVLLSARNLFVKQK